MSVGLSLLQSVKNSSFIPTFLDLKGKTGLTSKEIKKIAVDELGRVKHRVHERISLKRRRSQRKEVEDENVEEFLEEEEEYLEQEPSASNLGMVEEFIDVVEDTGDSTTMDTTTYAEAVESPHQEQSTEADEDFTPISNDRELKKVSQKINSDPIYLKNLRLRVVEESQEGICSLEQIFTGEFLRGCNMFGTFEQRKLPDLVPYKAIYFCEYFNESLILL